MPSSTPKTNLPRNSPGTSLLVCFIKTVICSPLLRHPKGSNVSFKLIISLLFVIGLFFSLVSTSLIASDKLDTNSYFFFFKHLIYIFIGIFIIFIFSSLKTNQLFHYSYFLFFITLATLLLVPIIGVEVKGSKRWIDLFFLPL